MPYSVCGELPVGFAAARSEGRQRFCQAHHALESPQSSGLQLVNVYEALHHRLGDRHCRDTLRCTTLVVNEAPSSPLQMVVYGRAFLGIEYRTCITALALWLLHDHSKGLSSPRSQI